MSFHIKGGFPMSKFCNVCGSQLDDNALFCTVCGAKFSSPEPQPQYQESQPQPQQFQQPFDDYNMQADVAANKNLAALGYISGMIILALVAAPNSRFIRFHANQALLLTLFAFLSIIPVIGWIWGVFCAVCFIMGIVNALNGQFKELPLIGRFRIIN